MELEKKVFREDEDNNSDLEAKGQQNINTYSQPEVERGFTPGEYVSILEGAEFLREFEDRKGIRQESSLSKFSEEERVVPLSRIYRIAQDLGIEKRYVDKYLEIKFPSEEQKLKDFKKFGAILDDKLIFKFYKMELEEALVKTFPNERFRMDGNEFNSCVYIIEKKIKERGLFRKKRILIEEERKLASFAVNFTQLDLYDPCFLRACGETLSELTRIFDRKCMIACNYSIDVLK